MSKICLNCQTVLKDEDNICFICGMKTNDLRPIVIASDEPEIIDIDLDETIEIIDIPIEVSEKSFEPTYHVESNKSKNYAKHFIIASVFITVFLFALFSLLIPLLNPITDGYVNMTGDMMPTPAAVGRKFKTYGTSTNQSSEERIVRITYLTNDLETITDEEAMTMMDGYNLAYQGGNTYLIKESEDAGKILILYTEKDGKYTDYVYKKINGNLEDYESYFDFDTYFENINLD